jgi:predicted AlkP superfamily phosphohydrolase/phosphomutase/Tfp pilus assembly protein PilF
MSKFLLIGLDAADWGLISEKITQGKLPNLSRLIKTGASGPLRSLYPLFSPALWATIATGKRPYEHEITGFTLPGNSAVALQTYNSNSLRVPTLWDILSHVGKKSHVVGWWNTAPAQRIDGVIVDETFRVAERPATEAWEAAETSVSPVSFLEELKKHRTHPQKLSESLLHRLVPKLYEINPQEDPRLSAIAKILAEDLTTLEVSLYLMRETTWDFSTLCLMGLDSLCHQAMNYRSPLLPNQNRRDHELYGEVVDRAYELYDEWIGTLVTAAGREANVMIISDHGFYSDHRRPQNLGIEATAPCAQHSPIGTIIMQGPSIKQGAPLSHASILDICPTILSLFEVPLGKDMPGKALTMAFQKPHTLLTNQQNTPQIASWNNIKTNSLAPLLEKPSAAANEAALRQLVALGYLSDLPSKRPEALQDAYCDQLFHRALSYLENEKVDRALDLLEKARQAAQKEHLVRTDILGALATTYLACKKNRSAAANFLQLVRLRRRDALLAAQELTLKGIEISPTTPLTFSECWELKKLVTRAHFNEQGIFSMLALATNIAAPRHKSPSQDEKKKLANKRLFSLAEECPHDLFINLHAGKSALTLGADKMGLHFLERAAHERPEEAMPLALIAEYKNRTGFFLEAEEVSRMALQRDPLHAASWLALATTLTHQERWEEARTAAFQARHSVLRKEELCNLLAIIAFQKNGDTRRAIRYLALGKNAKNYLEKCATAYEKQTSSQFAVRSSVKSCHIRATPYLPFNDFSQQKFLSETKNNYELIIVTGIPRSGTSLVMQMLAAGGLPITTDAVRSADKNNPRGYFEHEKTKLLASDASFLKKGNAVKIVIPLLWKIPKNLSLKIIFIQRPLEEVIESQHRMAGKIGSREELEQVYRYYETKTEEIVQERSWPILRLSYADTLKNPHATAKAIQQFLGRTLDTEAMTATVDPSLHRVRRGS